MYALIIKVDNTQYHIKPIHISYKDSLNDILDSNIDDTVVKTIHIKLKLLRQDFSIIQLYISENDNILQLSKDFE